MISLLLALSCSKLPKDCPDKAPLAFTSGAPRVKSSYISANTLGTLPIYLSADFKNAGGSTSFLFNRTFSRGGDDKYHASPEVYWPLEDGTMDFLAYAGTDGPLTDTGNPSIVWETQPTDGATITFTNTKSADIDFVWAVANGKDRSGGDVDLSFSHALARLELQVEIPSLLGDFLCIKSVTFETGNGDRISLGGTFTIDNRRNVLTGTWGSLVVLSDYGFFTGQDITFSPSGLTSLDGLLDGTSRVAKLDAVVPLAHMFVPEQPIKNMDIIYSLNGGANRMKTFNLPRGTWEMGRVYTYRLTYSFFGSKEGYGGWDLLLDMSSKESYNGVDVK